MNLSSFVKVNGKIFVDNSEDILSESAGLMFNEYVHIDELVKIAKLIKDMTCMKEDDVFILGETYIKSTEQIIELVKSLAANLSIYQRVDVNSELIDIRKKLILNVGDLKRNGFGKVRYEYNRIELFECEIGRLTRDLDSITIADVRGMGKAKFTPADMRLDHWDTGQILRNFAVNNILELVYLMSSETFISKLTIAGSNNENIDRLFDTNYHCCSERVNNEQVSPLESLSFLYSMIRIMKQQLADLAENPNILGETEKVLDASEKLLVAQFIKLLFALGSLLNSTMYNVGLKNGCAKYKEEIEAFLG